jgi:hypothetical protein
MPAADPAAGPRHLGWNVRDGLRSRRRLRAPLLASALAGLVSLSLLLSACGGSSGSHAAQSGSTATQSGPSSTGPGGSTNAGGSVNSQLLAFSRCMRAHGVPNFPDPQPGANNAKFADAQQLRVGSSQLSAAENACQRLLPAGSDDRFPPGEVQQLLPGMRIFSRCMRSHRVPNWPDPSTDAEGRPVFQLSAHGFDRQQAHSPRITQTVDECQHLLPRVLGGVPVG